MPAAGVLANDTDPDPGTTLSAQLVSTTSHGSLTLNPDGSFFYTPQANFVGTDAFTYTASDGETSSSTATVTITVNPVNDAPVAVGDLYGTAEDVPLVVNAPGVLVNDTDIDGPSLSAAHRGARRARNRRVERERQLHVHAERELQRGRRLHVPGQ